MKDLSIAQQVLDCNESYVKYDFIARKERRKVKGVESLDRCICKENLLDVKKVFDKHGITFFLMYGTLLGAIREKDFIGHDTDTDIGVLESQRNKIIAALKELQELGFNLIRTGNPDDRATIIRNDEYIDFGLFRKEKDKSGLTYYQYANNREYGPHFDQFETVSFLGAAFLVPSNPEKLLDRWYGKDWSKPKRNMPARVYNYNYLKSFLKRVLRFIVRKTRKYLKKRSIR